VSCIDRETTLNDRGFVVYLDDEQDGVRTALRVVEASIACEGPHVWVFQGPKGSWEGVRLSVPQVLRVQQALAAWLDDAIHERLTEPFHQPLEEGDVCPRCSRKLEET